LSGTTTPTPLASVTPSNISFPNQYVGTSGLPQSVTVTNNGNAPLSITSTTASPGDFGTLSACGSSLAAETSCAIGVFFDPIASGARVGTLTIADNGPGSPQTVALSGTGQDFSMTSAAPTATIAAGQTATYSVAVSPGGGFNQTVSLSCTGAPSLSTCTVSPNSVTLNGSTSTPLTVTVSTTAHTLIFPGFPKMRPLRPVNLPLQFPVALLLALALTACLTRLAKDRKVRLATMLPLFLLLSSGIALVSCGGGGGGPGGSGPSQPGTPAGTYSLTVSGTFSSSSTTLTHNTKLTLVVQ